MATATANVVLVISRLRRSSVRQPRLTLGFVLVALVVTPALSPAAATAIVPGGVKIGLQQAFNVGGPATSLTPGPDGRLYVCTLTGTVRVIDNATVATALDLAAIPSVPFLSGSANGLYGVAFHPGFNTPASPGYRKIYTYADERKFAAGTSGPLTGLPDFWHPEQYAPGSPVPTVSNYATATFSHFNVLREWTMNLDTPAPSVVTTSSRVILRLAHPNSAGHNGTGPAFGPDGFLYLAIGDGGGSGNDYSGSVTSATDGHTNGAGNAQDRTNPFGKVLRIDPLPAGGNSTPVASGQYAIPAGNPFADGPGGNMDEIFAYGLRNPWGFSWDSRPGGDGRMFLANVGQHHREEINIITPGGNYGWGYLEGGVPLIQQDNYSGDTLTAAVTFVRTPPGGFAAFSSIPPLAEYKTRRQYAPDGAAAVPANLAGEGTAATGGFVYRGTAIPALAGRYVFGDYAVSEDSPPPGFTAHQARLFHLDPAQPTPPILEFTYTTGTTVPSYLLGFGQDNAGELYALFASGDVKKLVPPSGAPELFSSPVSRSVTIGGSVVFSVAANGPGPFAYQWTHNGAPLAGATNATFVIASAQPAAAGIYRCDIANAAGTVTSEPAILGLSTAAKVAGSASEVGANIPHPNGNIYDQLLLQGPAASLTADPGQVARISYVDLNHDIVQIEFAGAGTLTVTLDNASGPAAPANYNQPSVAYMKGHASIVIAGADASTNVSVFSVGRANAVNQALFRSEVAYDGIADLGSLSIIATSGAFGGIRTANVNYFNTRSLTGILAPGVQFAGPVFIGDINASDSATPAILLGSASDTRIAGGDLLQANARAVQVSGLTQLRFVPGATSHGVPLPAQTNRARLEQAGADVTAQIVVNP